MKKYIVFVVLALFVAVPAGADQMTVKLKSGNSIIIESSGPIDGVTLQGDSDAIVGMKTQKSSEQVPQFEPSKNVQPSADDNLAAEPQVSKGHGSSVRIKWTKPMDDENLKNARSDSRRVSWF